jgi:hypothetical protein
MHLHRMTAVVSVADRDRTARSHGPTADAVKPDAKAKKAYDKAFLVSQGLYIALRGQFPKLCA